MNSEIIPRYLAATAVVDFDHKDVQAMAQRLAASSNDRVQTAKYCFEWVRDRIEHSMDANKSPVTCSASEVLKTGHGLCYAKSHLLVALLRANGIPAGFSYQRLVDDLSGYCLHGFVGMLLPGIGWYRVDARGNKAGVNAQFVPPTEQLAFTNHQAGEIDYGMIISEPWPTVVRALHEAVSIETLAYQLPDKIMMS